MRTGATKIRLTKRLAKRNDFMLAKSGDAAVIVVAGIVQHDRNGPIS